MGAGLGSSSVPPPSTLDTSFAHTSGYTHAYKSAPDTHHDTKILLREVNTVKPKTNQVRVFDV